MSAAAAPKGQNDTSVENIARNLTPDAHKLLLGRRYNRVKKAPNDGGAGTPKATEGQSDPRFSTAAALAKEHGVSEKTVKRAGKFAEEVEADPDLKAAVEAGQSVASDAMGRGDASAKLADASFAEDQAAKTGQAPRTIRQDAERGEKVCDDKRRAVLTLLNDPEWSAWSDREIARACGVSHPFVAGQRGGVTGNVTSERAYTTKHGSTATMNTANIGLRSNAGQVAKSAA